MYCKTMKFVIDVLVINLVSSSVSYEPQNDGQYDHRIHRFWLDERNERVWFFITVYSNRIDKIILDI